MKQEFHRGDLVRTRDVMWGCWDWGVDSTKIDSVRTPAHWGIIVGSYRDQYGGGECERHTYTILKLKDNGDPDYRWSWLDATHIEYLVLPRCIENLDILDDYEDL